jgi:hypothetical protein
MKQINLALAGGNKTLLKVQGIDKVMGFQIDYTGIVATTVTVEVWVSIRDEGPYTKIDDATLSLVPADGTGVLALSDLGNLFVQYRLNTAGVTVGTITKIEVQDSTNLEYYV